MEQNEGGKGSHKQILKSSLLIGGSQIIIILITLVKNKAIAIILGPIGIGLVGMFFSFCSLITSIAGLGINSSSVKFVAEYHAKNQVHKVYAVIASIRRFLFLTSAAAFLILLLCNDLFFKVPGNYDKIIAYSLLGGIIFFDNMSAGERGILQGLRQLKAIAGRQVLGGLLAAIFSICIVYFLKEDGILFSLFFSSLVIYLILRWNGSNGRAGKNTSFQFKEEIKPVFNLGLVFLVTNIWGTLMAYVIRIIILKQNGMEAVGIYQSSWGFVTASFNVILLALGTDLYPRLTSFQDNKNEFDRTLNEQVEVSLYLALPVLVLIYLLSPYLIRLLYSSKFLNGVELTRWLVFSCFFQIVCWPLSYVIIIKGSKRLFLLTTIAWEVVHLPLVFLCLRYWGIDGIGISYVITYIIVAFGSTMICRKFFGFQWDKKVLGLTFAAILLFGVLVSLNLSHAPASYFYATGILLFLITSVISVRAFQRIMNIKIIDLLGKTFRLRM